MIVRMKKISCVVQSKDIGTALKALAKIGVLHIEHQNTPLNDDVSALKERYKLLSRGIDALPVGAGEGKDIHEDPDRLINEILSLSGEKDVLKEEIDKIKRDIELWREWGDFDPELIDELREKHIRISLCKLTRPQIKKLPKEIIIEQLFRKGKIIFCAAVSRKEMTLPFETLQLPEQGIKEMSGTLEKEQQRLREIGLALQDASRYKDSLISYRKKIYSLIEYNKVAAGAGRFERLSYVRGYCPLYSVRTIERIAREERWALLIEDPDDTDNVPTLIKNPRWIEIIRPVFEMINTMPGYKEVDISLWFLLFFSVFFGILVGDAGYGAVFFIATLACHIRFRASVKDKSIFFLMYTLSLCAVIWGVLTGTFFGQAYLSQRVKPLLPLLRNNANVQALCFFIGALQLSVAHAWKLIRKLPSLKSLSEAGWISMLWAAYFLARSLILTQPFPHLGKWFFITGAGLIILFTNPERNVFKTLSSGIGNFLLHLVNSFTDVVSYIRLFAVGAATVAVADAFNQMASGVGYNNIFAGFLTAVILLFGHILNILLSAMAILVHGVRLNVLEFSSHLDMEWSGIEYKPFKDG